MNTVVKGSKSSKKEQKRQYQETKKAKRKKDKKSAYLRPSDSDEETSHPESSPEKPSFPRSHYPKRKAKKLKDWRPSADIDDQISMASTINPGNLYKYKN
jgi:hypothetical protein